MNGEKYKKVAYACTYIAIAFMFIPNGKVGSIIAGFFVVIGGICGYKADKIDGKTSIWNFIYATITIISLIPLVYLVKFKKDTSTLTGIYILLYLLYIMVGIIFVVFKYGKAKRKNKY